MLASENKVDYYTHLLNKQKCQQDDNVEKMKRGQVSLELNHEKRMGEMKEYFNKLNDKVDSNMNRYSDYNNKNQRNSPLRPYDNLVIDHNTSIDRNIEPSYIDSYRPDRDNNININNPYTNNTYFAPESKPVKSDVTSNFIFDKLQNRDYKTYREINQTYYNYNRDMIDNHQRRKDDDYNNKRLASMERVKDLDRYNQANMEAKNFKSEQQKLYRYILDNQVKNRDYPLSTNNLASPSNFKDDRVVINPCKIFVIFR
jgi:hypothetical protein